MSFNAIQHVYCKASVFFPADCTACTDKIQIKLVLCKKIILNESLCIVYLETYILYNCYTAILSGFYLFDIDISPKVSNNLMKLHYQEKN